LAWSKILYTAVGTFANHEKETASLRKICSTSAACGLDYFMRRFLFAKRLLKKRIVFNFLFEKVMYQVEL